MSDRKTALITGASSGIGLELTRLFARDGYNTIVIARREERLNNLKKELERETKTTVLVVPIDLSEPGAGSRLHEEIASKGVRVDVLVNNAGFGGSGEFIEREWEKDKSMIQVNILALTELTRFFAADMAKRNSGAILNIASTAAFMPGPLQAVYFATKAYVASFSQAIAEELRGKGVSVSVYCPAATATEFAAQAGLEDAPVFSGKAASPAVVAARAYRQLQRKKLVVLGDRFQAFAFRFMFPFMSRRLILRISRSFSE